jgi:tetratricopeptide (TPR) repeat protein
MSSPTLSITICVKNEELLLGRVLDCATRLADEVIVVDNGSTDSTPSIAEATTARLIRFEGDNHLEAWNVALRAATSDWVLNLDGDEIIDEVDFPELRRLLHVSPTTAYQLRARNYSTLMDLAYHWYPNSGRYPELERLSGCPGYWTSYPLRLLPNDPGVEFRVGATNHTSPDQSIDSLGWKVKKSEVTLHNLGVVKGGDRYLADKNASRLKGEILHENRAPMDEVNLARTYFFLGKDKQALDHLEAALAAEPSLTDALYLKGVLLKENGELRGAEEALLNLLAGNSDHEDGWTVLGMVYQLMGCPRQSEGALRRALSCRETHPLAHNSLGIALEDQGRTEEAEVSYLRALEIHPTLPSALDNLIGLYEESDRAELAEKYRALERAPNPVQ